ncbi:MAG: bifunctional glutamate N-acetyltransferase/amino-acid acetyltransferase ArgJ [Anaerolineaceae bacterium]|nr:bifunctional glutamate N-acetyltransferase/amino-acid acetyltransferase ArgJ [Anaerolineaceae bacterium]
MSNIQAAIPSIPGFRVSGVHAGIKKNGNLDFALIVSDTPGSASGVFTTNQVKASSVVRNMGILAQETARIRAIAINSGCANACTGQQGMDNTYQTAQWVAQHIGCAEDEVLVMSTGVIGAQLPMDKIRRGIELAADALSVEGWDAAARAIMTTDTRPKTASTTLQAANGKTYTIAGVAKGSGMIAPNMATMLGVVIANAPFAGSLGSLLHTAADETFNRIVVDGDMSTNDTVLLLVNNASGAVEPPAGQYPDAVRAVSRKLAQDIVRDGEGVTKFITLHITGAPDTEAARHIAHTIATSALVKTAFYGNDANWGRIIAAAGRAGIPLDPDRMSLRLIPGESLIHTDASVLLFANGMPTDYREADAAAIIRQSSIVAWLDCGAGNGVATVWTCDLSHDYVSINAEYRT